MYLYRESGIRRQGRIPDPVIRVEPSEETDDELAVYVNTCNPLTAIGTVSGWNSVCQFCGSNQLVCKFSIQSITAITGLWQLTFA